MALITLQQARDRIRIYINDEDQDVLSMIEQASRAVINRVDDRDVTDDWNGDDQETVPEDVQAAVIEMVAYLYERDVTINQRPDTRGHLPPRVEMLLGRYTRPALA